MSKLSNDGFDNEVGINFCILQAIYVGLLAFPVPSNVFLHVLSALPFMACTRRGYQYDFGMEFDCM